MDRRKSPSRAGFTLVEVLVAILIIATLVAILLPAVRGAFRKAQEAQVTTELNNLATALASFKNTFGDYPPSRIILCEAGYNASGLLASSTPAGPLSPSGHDTDITQAQLVQRSRLFLRRFWPRVDFDTGSVAYDFNNNGSYTDILTLSGSECLTFFLGGQPVNNIDGVNITTTHSQGFKVTGVNGFTKLPINPFIPLNAVTSLNPSTSNRTVPNYEFNTSRLVDQDGDGIPSYMDPIDTTSSNSRAYAYFLSYGTNSYDPNDDNGNGGLNPFEEEDTGSYVTRGFTVGFPTTQTTNAPYVATSPSPNPYCTGNPITTGGMSWINPNSFQLFSSGQDRLWGMGGQYVQSGITAQNNVSTAKLPLIQSDPGIVNSTDFTNGIRNSYEADNVTNFSGGRLD